MRGPVRTTGQEEDKSPKEANKEMKIKGIVAIIVLIALPVLLAACTYGEFATTPTEPEASPPASAPAAPAPSTRSGDPEVSGPAGAESSEPDQPSGNIEIEPQEIRSPSGPLDTTLAEVTLLSSQGDLTKVRVEEIRDYNRVPGATYPELRSGDEITVRIYDRATVGADLNEGAHYLAGMSLCLSGVLGGLECPHEGWSVALYPLTVTANTPVSDIQ